MIKASFAYPSKLLTVMGKKIGEGLNRIPTKDQAREIIRSKNLQPLAPDRLEREKLIFRSYDSMNVNVRANSHLEKTSLAGLIAV